MLKLEIGDRDYKESNSITHCCVYHAVWCTKYRRNILDQGAQDKLNELLHHYQSSFKYDLVYIDMKLDQVHIILQASPEVSISRLIGSLKKSLVRPLLDEHPHIAVGMPNLWTRASFIASCGTVTLDNINTFLQAQTGV